MQCPIGACICTNMGVTEKMSKATGNPGHPANGDANYVGLCSFACNYGHCPSSACSSTPQPPYIPLVSPFDPPACTDGTGEGNAAGLCNYSCAVGFCPIAGCTCTLEGALVPPASAGRPSPVSPSRTWILTSTIPFATLPAPAGIVLSLLA